MTDDESRYASSRSVWSQTPNTRHELQGTAFFSQIAERIVEDLGVQRVLDAGCSPGLLVEELRRRGVDARGFDRSEMADGQVPPELRPYVQIGDITDPHLLAGEHFDLVTCIEAGEQIPVHQASAAVMNLCRWGDAVLFSADAEDGRGPAHPGRPRPGDWARLFAACGFSLDSAYSAAYVSPWAMLFRRGAPASAEAMAAEADLLVERQQAARKTQSTPDTAESLALHWRPTRREALEMRWARVQRRWLLLRRTASVALKQEGPKAVAMRGWHWLRGDRGYWRQLSQNSANSTSGMSDADLHAPYDPAAGDFLRYRFAGNAYALHARLHEPDDEALQAQRREAARWTHRPLLSIVTPVYNPPLPVLHELIFSLRAQTYPEWEWIAADSSSNPDVWAALGEAAASDARIKPVRLERNEGISGNTNAALSRAGGEFIVLLDHDDTLASQALYRIAQVMNTQPAVDFIYSDEDKLNSFNRRCDPFYKPDWSPELMLSGNILIHAAAFRRTLLASVGMMNPATDGAQDWDFFLRISEFTQAFAHIPEVLYHWRMSDVSTASSHTNKPYVQIAQISAVQQHLKRLGLKNPETRFIPGHVIFGVSPVSQWDITQPPRVSIIIPTRDKGRLLKKCLGALLSLTAWQDYEVILVDSGSTEKATLDYYAQLRGDARVRVVAYRATEFNFGEACNQGAALATGSLLLFLNNDVEVLQRDWLQRMAQWFELPQVGIVGPKLLFPSGEIQHAGIVLGMTGLAAHVFAGSPENLNTVFGSDGWYRNYLAVTGACLMIRRTLFQDLGGFDEAYRMDFSDIALCVRAHAKGWRIVYTPTVRLIHHESASRSLARYRSDYERATEEFRLFLEQGDPYYNRNYSSRHTYPTLRQDEPSASVLHRSMMAQAAPGDTFDATSLIFGRESEPGQ